MSTNESVEQAAPLHRFELRISIGANTWEYTRIAINEIAEYINSRQPDQVNVASGGWNGSYSATLAQREVSPDDYRKELDQWRQSQVAKK